MSWWSHDLLATSLPRMLHHLDNTIVRMKSSNTSWSPDVLFRSESLPYGQLHFAGYTYSKTIVNQRSIGGSPLTALRSRPSEAGEFAGLSVIVLGLLVEITHTSKYLLVDVILIPGRQPWYRGPSISRFLLVDIRSDSMSTGRAVEAKNIKPCY